MNYKVLALVASAVLVSTGGMVFAETREKDQRQGGRTKEQVCMDLLAKADEKAQNKQEYLDKIDQALEKLTNLELPDDVGVDAGLIEEKKAQAQAKTQELKAKIEELYEAYASVRPQIDCSNPEEALQTVKNARDEMGMGTFVSRYVENLDTSDLNAQSRTVREEARTVFGSLMRR